MEKTVMIQLVTTIINGIVQLSYVGLTGYGIHQFVGLCKYWIGNSADVQEVFKRKPEPTPDELMESPFGTKETPVELGLKN